MSIVHHDLCFGCGRTNLFGLQMELDAAEEGVSGRFFLKQDHQGPPNKAHGGVIAAALDEAMALTVHVEGIRAFTRRLELDLLAPAAVGTFVQVRARIDRQEGGTIETSAFATDERGERLAAATATFVSSGRDSV